MARASSESPRQPSKLPAAVPPPPEPPEESVLKAVIDVTKAELDTEFKLSERYDTKARTFFGFAALLFGVTQAFVLRRDFGELASGQSDALQIAIVGAGIGLLAALVGVMRATLQQPDVNFDHMELFKLSRDKSKTLQDIAQMYAVELGERRKANGERLHVLRISQIASSLALVATAIEFVLAAVFFI